MKASEDQGREGFSELYNYAVRLLARREHARKELQLKLASRTECTATVDAVLAKLAEQNYLNDARFTEVYIRYRSARGFGMERISRELAERGVDASLIPAALAEVEKEAVDWELNIEQVWRKKFKRPPADYTERGKQVRFLMYRGFSQSQIKSHFARLAADNPDDTPPL